MGFLAALPGRRRRSHGNERSQRAPRRLHFRPRVAAPPIPVGLCARALSANQRSAPGAPCGASVSREASRSTERQPISARLPACFARALLGNLFCFGGTSGFSLLSDSQSETRNEFLGVFSHHASRVSRCPCSGHFRGPPKGVETPREPQNFFFPPAICAINFLGGPRSVFWGGVGFLGCPLTFLRVLGGSQGISGSFGGSGNDFWAFFFEGEHDLTSQRTLRHKRRGLLT